MTRKRFVKLLMARGASRNLAATLAARTVAAGKSYEEGYPAAVLAIDVANGTYFAEIGKAFAAFAETASRAGAAIGAAIRAFYEAHRKVTVGE